jgi:hypothetical protein
VDDSRPKTPQVWAIAEKAQQMEVAAGEVGMAIPWFPEDDFCFFSQWEIHYDWGID